MGTSKHGAELVGKLHALSTALPAAGAAGLVKAAAVVEASVGIASGRYRGHKITEVRTFMTGEKAVVKMTSRKAHLLDHDTHYPQKSRSLTASSTFVPREGVRTQGKFMWEKGVTAARPGVVKAMGDAVAKSIAKVFH